MESSAFKVRVASPPAVLLINAPATWVMFPSSGPPPVAVLVSRVTLVPVFRALLIKSAPTVFVPIAPPEGTMVISVGSISQVPPIPLGAEASGVLVRLRNCLPDVSINPPLPETTPPLAVNSP